MTEHDVIFEPLEFRNLTVKNRVFRSSLSGRFNNYDGIGNADPHQLGREVRDAAASARSSPRTRRCIRAG